jgi:hypothetical protein
MLAGGLQVDWLIARMDKDRIRIRISFGFGFFTEGFYRWGISIG